MNVLCWQAEVIRRFLIHGFVLQSQKKIIRFLDVFHFLSQTSIFNFPGPDRNTTGELECKESSQILIPNFDMSEILLFGVPTVWGLKFSMAQKNAKSTSWGKCQLWDKNVTLGRTIFFPILQANFVKLICFSLK